MHKLTESKSRGLGFGRALVNRAREKWPVKKKKCDYSLKTLVYICLCKQFQRNWHIHSVKLLRT